VSSASSGQSFDSSGSYDGDSFVVSVGQVHVLCGGRGRLRGGECRHAVMVERLNTQEHGGICPKCRAPRIRQGIWATLGPVETPGAGPVTPATMRCSARRLTL
jgi:hypothetical protein